MKPTKKGKSDPKGCAEAAFASIKKNHAQMAFSFDSPTEQSVARTSSLIIPAEKPEVKETAYSSVKRVSLVFVGSLEGRPCIASTIDAKEFFKQYWKSYPANDQEQIVVACLDTKHRVQCVVMVTLGTLDSTLVHPREVFKPAFIEGSSAIVLSHNHPSGNPTPSREDHQVTDRLTEVGKLIGITVLDHIIHGDGTGEVLSIREC